MNQDRYCPSCNFKIFASKSKCFKCKVARPGSTLTTSNIIKQPTDQ